LESKTSSTSWNKGSDKTNMPALSERFHAAHQFSLTEPNESQLIRSSHSFYRMSCLCLLQANSNPSVTTAALEQTHSVFTLDKECLEPAVDQLHFTNRNFIYNAIVNSISIRYLLLSITTFLLPKTDRYVSDQSSTNSTNLPIFRTLATGTCTMTALSNSTCATPATKRDLLPVTNTRRHQLLATGIQAPPTR